MKYMIIGSVKEPYEENYAKVLEIEKKRQEKGEAFSLQNKMLTSMYVSVGSPSWTYWVVDCEPEDIVKWSKVYADVMVAEVIPVMTRDEWAKL
jgi:hypothetical protein